MESVQCIGDLNAEVKQGFNVQRLATDPMAKCLALQQFHGDEGSPLRLINLVDGADVRMIQCGSCLGFTLKTAERMRAFGCVVRQELERNKATELHILGFKNDPHRAGAKLLNDVIVRNGLANHWRESYFRESDESMKPWESALPGRPSRVPLTLL